MAAEDQGVQDDTGSFSPKNKVKFLCSHGGKVLPRPSDGNLKYVGGETRVVSLPRIVTFSEMRKKLNGMIEGAENMVLKYQLIPEDLDALVSVKNDEDLKHMIEEHDRHQTGMLRAFLFPSKPVVVVDQGAAAVEPEQRYIDAVNGIIVRNGGRLSPIRAFCNTSACSSPKSTSPDGHTADLTHHEPPFRLAMTRVRSSPNMSNLHTLALQQQQQQQQQQPQPLQHCHHNNQQHLPFLAYPSTSSSAAATPLRTPPLQDPPQPQLQGGIGRHSPLMTSTTRGSNGINYYYSRSTSSRLPKGYAYYDDSPSSAVYGNSLPPSPAKSIWD